MTCNNSLLIVIVLLVESVKREVSSDLPPGNFHLPLLSVKASDSIFLGRELSIKARKTCSLSARIWREIAEKCI